MSSSRFLAIFWWLFRMRHSRISSNFGAKIQICLKIKVFFKIEFLDKNSTFRIVCVEKWAKGKEGKTKLATLEHLSSFFSHHSFFAGQVQVRLWQLTLRLTIILNVEEWLMKLKSWMKQKVTSWTNWLVNFCWSFGRPWWRQRFFVQFGSCQCT